MRRLLHIIVEDHDLVRALISEQQREPNHVVDVVELGCGNPDYSALLQKIFAADSLQVW